MKIALLGPIATAGIVQFLSSPPPAAFPTGYSGAPFMNSLIEELLRRGHEICAITAGGYPASSSSRPLKLEGPRFTYYCCPSRTHSVRPSAGRVGRILDFFSYEREHMAAVLSIERPDIVHAHWTYEFAMAAMESRKPCLVTIHDDPWEVLKLSRTLYRLGRYAMARRVLHRANALTAVSEDLKRRVHALARVEIAVIPNPLSRRFIAIGAAQPARPIRKSRAIISIINGWSRLKNNANALLAFSHIRRQFPDATYHLYGNDNEPGGPAEQWALARGLSEGVVFHGPVPHDMLTTALRGAALLLHPSRTESFGMVIAEALAFGLPVVAGHKSGAVPEIVGDAGLLVDISDPAAIADAVARLLSDDGLYELCSAAASHRIEAFAPNVVVSRYEQIYRSLIENMG